MGVIINTKPQSNKEESISVTGDGVKTKGALANELYNLIDFSKVTDKTVLRVGDAIYHLIAVGSNRYVRFVSTFVYEPNFIDTEQWYLRANNSFVYTGHTGTSSTSYTNDTSAVVGNGTKLTLTY